MSHSDSNKQLLETYISQRHALKRFLSARLGNESDAEDLLQELFIRVEKSTVSEEIENVTGYLYKMALNLARDHRRERARSQRRDAEWVETATTRIGPEAVAEIPSAEASYIAKQGLATIIAAIEELTPHCRRVFILHKLEGLSHAEISERLDISRSTVEKHMHTALKHLLLHRQV